MARKLRFVQEAGAFGVPAVYDAETGEQLFYGLQELEYIAAEGEFPTVRLTLLASLHEFDLSGEGEVVEETWDIATDILIDIEEDDDGDDVGTVGASGESRRADEVARD